MKRLMLIETATGVCAAIMFLLIVAFWFSSILPEMRIARLMVYALMFFVLITQICVIYIIEDIKRRKRR